MVDKAYPQESDAQEIGHMATRTLEAVMPLSWRTKSLEGTDDVGLDFQVQIVDGKQYREIFRLQLKGTTVPDIGENGAYLSVQIKVSTLNYYADTVEPILFVLCDLSRDEDPRNCPAYYVWIKDEVRRHFDKGLADSQQTVTIRVPLENKLDKTFDVRAVIAESRRLQQGGRAIDESIRDRFPESDSSVRGELIDAVSQGISQRSSVFVHAIAERETFWPEAPVHSIAGQLTATAAALKRGDDSEAGRLLGKVRSNLDEATTLERAAYYYLSGKVATARSDDNAALIAFKEACTLSPTNTKYQISRIECALALRKCRTGVVTDVSDLLEEARSLSGTPAVGLQARLLAINGQLTDARELVSEEANANNAADAVVIETMSGNNSTILDACCAALAYDDLEPHLRLLILLVRARTLLFSAVGIESFDDDQIVFPLGGPSNLDTKQLGLAWDGFQQVLPLLRTAGWPRIVEYVVDAWVLASVLTGKESETFPHIHAAAVARPQIVELQRGLERIAAGVGDFGVALSANARQLHDDCASARRVILFRDSGNPKDCLITAIAHAESGNKDSVLFPLAICLGILCADVLMRPADARMLEAILGEQPRWSAQKAILDFVRSKQDNVLSLNEALDRLKDAYDAHEQDAAIGLQLLTHLPVHEHLHAACFIAVAMQMERSQRLPQDLLLRLAQAHATLDEWDSLIRVADAALLQYSNMSRLRAARAVALDKLGFTNRAFEDLKTLLSEHPEDRLAIDAYVNIVMRFGEADAAIALVERLLPKEEEPRQRFELTSLLFSLVQQSDPESNRLLEIAWQMGKDANAEIEQEEGRFLRNMLTASMASRERIDAIRQDEVVRRRDAFVQRFPSSKIYRIGWVSDANPVDDIKRMLADIDPDAEARQVWQRGVERKMERGEFAAPFVWRPRRVLGYLRDAMELWEFSKRSRRDAQQLHLTMIVDDWKQAEVPTKTPIIDLTALFVLHDLDLFDVLFSVFQRVAISQSTLLYVQSVSEAGVGRSSSRLAKSIQSKLRENLPKIIQPTATLPSSEDGNAPLVGEDLKVLLGQGDYTLYSDDGFFSVYVGNSEGSSVRFCSLDLLYAAMDRQLITLRDVAEKVGLLLSWNVRLAVSPEVLFSSLPAGLAIAKSVSEAADLIQKDAVCSPILEAIWSVRQRFQQLHDVAVHVIRALIKDERNAERSIAALLCVWYWKAKLRTDVGAPPLYRLALAFVHACEGLEVDDKTARRLKNVYLAVVEVDRGASMDERDEHEAIQILGRRAAEFDSGEKPAESPLVGKKLGQAWTERTADHERFLNAYTTTTIELKKNRGEG